MKDALILCIILVVAVSTALGVTARREAELRAKLRVVEQPLICTCSLHGSVDEVSWDVNLGEIKATITKNPERYLPARAACGPLQLRAWMGVDAP